MSERDLTLIWFTAERERNISGAFALAVTDSKAKKFLQVWKYLRGSKGWQNFHFWVNYPFKADWLNSHLGDPLKTKYTILHISSFTFSCTHSQFCCFSFCLSDDSSLSKDISSVFSAEGVFPLEDELRIEPLSLDGLSMLSDPDMVLPDPSVEDSFRSDRL